MLTASATAYHRRHRGTKSTLGAGAKNAPPGPRQKTHPKDRGLKRTPGAGADCQPRRLPHITQKKKEAVGVGVQWCWRVFGCYFVEICVKKNLKDTDTDTSDTHFSPGKLATFYAKNAKHAKALSLTRVNAEP